MWRAKAGRSPLRPIDYFSMFQQTLQLIYSFCRSSRLFLCGFRYVEAAPPCLRFSAATPTRAPTERGSALLLVLFMKKQGALSNAYFALLNLEPVSKKCLIRTSFLQLIPDSCDTTTKFAAVTLRETQTPRDVLNVTSNTPIFSALCVRCVNRT